MELDPALPSPHRLMGSHYFLREARVNAAIPETRKGGPPGTGQCLGPVYCASVLSVARRLPEAEAQLDHTALILPKSSLVAAMRSQVYIWSRR